MATLIVPCLFEFCLMTKISFLDLRTNRKRELLCLDSREHWLLFQLDNSVGRDDLGLLAQFEQCGSGTKAASAALLMTTSP